MPTAAEIARLHKERTEQKQSDAESAQREGVVIPSNAHPYPLQRVNQEYPLGS